jgi:hypothetical protein
MSLALLAGCNQQKPAVSERDAALANAIDAKIAQIRASNPGIKETCLTKLRANQLGATEWVNNPDCFEMMPEQRWSGLWNSGWEWTNFCPEPAEECPGASDRGDIWLKLAKDAYRGPELLDGVYRIEFVGRRTKVPGHFGHLGQYDYLMVADRVISIKEIPGEKYTKRF